nr:tetratricopeptide repeat protein [Chloroflexia bacterium]
VLEGEAGIGKTRLAEDFLADVVASGALAFTTRSYEGEANLAYGMFIELLRAATAQIERDSVLEAVPPWARLEAARLLPELGGRPLVPSSPLDTPGAQARFFEGIYQVFLAPLRGRSPVVLFVDDAQWVDAASLNLLAYVVRRVHDQPLLLLIAWRGEDRLADHHLHPLLSDARRTGTLTVLRLPRLDRSNVEELVALAMTTDTNPTSTERLNSRVPENLGQRLYEETEGVPLFLKEYLTAIATGELEAGDTDWALPDGLRGMLRSRLATMSDPGRHLLSVAATIGRSFDYDILQVASGRDDETTVAALEQLIARGVIKEVMRSGATETPTYDFHHEKLRTIAYQEISLARRRLLYRRVAEALVSRARTRRDGDAPAAQIAQHFERAGQERDAATFFAKAGEQARAVYANVEALAHFRAALELGHPDLSMLHEAIGDLQTLLGEYAAALASYECASGHDISTDMARLERKRAEVYHRRGDWALAERALRTAMTALGETGPMAVRSRLHADQSLVVHHQGRTEEAITLARQALQLAQEANDRRALAQVHNVLGILASHRGDFAAARRHLEQSAAVAEALGDPGFRVAALNNLALAHGAAGEVECALKFTETALTLCAARGDRHREAALHNNLADLLHAAGRSTEAVSHVKQAVAIYAEIGVEAGSLRPEIWKLAEW